MANTQPFLGIIAALPAEARSLGVDDVPVGQVVEVAHNVVLIRCGIGRVRAERAARALIRAGAGALLSWGTAAALSRDLGNGDLVLPLEVLSRNGRRFAVDHRWHHGLAETIESQGGRCGGTLAEADSVLRDADDKLRLRNLSGAPIADLESAAIAEVCHGADIPLLVVRAVSDPATTRIPDSALAAVDENGDVSVARCLAKLVFAPGDVPALVRLGRGFRAACGALSELARRAGPEFRWPATGAPVEPPKPAHA
jgi:adenosylhomocysteine nucleosidase